MLATNFTLFELSTQYCFFAHSTEGILWNGTNGIGLKDGGAVTALALLDQLQSLLSFPRIRGSYCFLYMAYLLPTVRNRF